MKPESKLQLFYLTSIFSVLFAVLGFSYNTWRMELSEDNNNIRTASFEVLLQLSELEQIIYAAHYDKNEDQGSPRKAWVKVGLIIDLSQLIGPDVEIDAENLKRLWSQQWQFVATNETATQALVKQIESVRKSINQVLKNLQ